jgi:hypothetical protein
MSSASIPAARTRREGWVGCACARVQLRFSLGVCHQQQGRGNLAMAQYRASARSTPAPPSACSSW